MDGVRYERKKPLRKRKRLRSIGFSNVKTSPCPFNSHHPIKIYLSFHIEFFGQILGYLYHQQSSMDRPRPQNSDIITKTTKFENTLD